MAGFSPQCKDLCELAKNRWLEMCRKITAGDCTKFDLDRIVAKREQMMQLTTAIATLDISATHIEEQIKLQLNLYGAFLSMCSKLAHLCSLLPERVVGM